jgi:major membrane immunogen (membrane-anchored lipoprotein)
MDAWSFNRNETCSLHAIAKTNAHLVKTGTLDKTEGTITNGQSRETGTQEDQNNYKKTNTICVGHHYTQTSTNNVN